MKSDRAANMKNSTTARTSSTNPVEISVTIAAASTVPGRASGSRIGPP